MDYVDINKLKEELKDEIKQELLKELKIKDEIYTKRQVFSRKIREKYHDKIYEKFGATGTIEDAIKYVVVYSMGYRKMASIPYSRQEEFDEKMEEIYKFVLGDEINGD